MKTKQKIFKKFNQKMIKSLKNNLTIILKKIMNNFKIILKSKSKKIIKEIIVIKMLMIVKIKLIISQ